MCVHGCVCCVRMRMRMGMGMGRARADLAVRLSRAAKVKVVVSARRVEELNKLADECRALGAEAWVVQADMGVEADCRRLMEESARLMGGMDVVVLNAGVSMSAALETIPDLGLFRRLMETNYYGVVACVQAALPHVRRSRGTIAVVSSQAGIACPPLRTGYCASKAAVNAFLDSLRAELDPADGVKICTLLPGFVRTDIRAHALGSSGAEGTNSHKYDEKGMMEVDVGNHHHHNHHWHHTHADRGWCWLLFVVCCLWRTQECNRIIMRAIAEGRREERFDRLGMVMPLARALIPDVVTRVARKKVFGMLEAHKQH